MIDLVRMFLKKFNQKVDHFFASAIQDLNVHFVDRQYFNIKHWPCHTSNTECTGSVPDTTSPAYNAWVMAQNIKATKDAATVGDGATGLMRAGLLAETVGAGSTVASLYAD